MILRFVVTGLLLVLAGCGPEPPLIIDGPTMGTTYRIKIVDADVDEARLREEIDQELRRINDLMSTYIPESEISRFNRAPLGEWIPVSGDLLEVVALARQIHQDSGGAFDPTVGPLVNLWGFGPNPGDQRVPGDDEIAATRTRVGFDLLASSQEALKRDGEIYVDLSAIAKGYGVDQVAELLDRHRIVNYLVEVGGELRARGRNDRNQPWRIAIERPDTGYRVPFETVNLSDLAMATSGDYRNFFEIDGVRYSHTIDPATGRPITHNLASVTVIAETAALADGMATAINVMGSERGLSLAEELNLAVFVIIKTAQGYVEQHSTAFEVFLDD